MIASKMVSELRLGYTSKSNTILRMETVHNEVFLIIKQETNDSISETNIKVDKATLLRLKSMINTHLINTKK